LPALRTRRRVGGRREYAEALDLYWQAWDLLPEPKTDWESEDLLQILADHSARTAADEEPSENI